jgi:hypothetical protein
MTEKRTYRWYTTHDTYVGRDEYYETDDRGIFSETHSRGLQKALGDIIDLVPDFDNFTPRSLEYQEWYNKVDKDWNEFEKAKKEGSYLVAWHWIGGRILQDPDLTDRDRILEFVARNCPKCLISVIYNPKVSESLLLEILNRDPKKDPTRGTKSGEIGRFILYNKKVSSKVVDLVARKTKKVTIQRSVIRHPNVSRETLVWLSKEGKNSNVQKDALNELVERGFVKVD